MTLKEYALKLREELINNPSPEKAKDIAERILNVNVDKRKITEEEINNVINWIENPTYEPSTGVQIEYESDNSAFLNLIKIVAQNVNQTKNK